jgi:hypothetical protein
VTKEELDAAMNELEKLEVRPVELGKRIMMTDFQ